MMIDLRSDTVTRPTKGMLEAMMSAKIGDDVFGEDPTINELEIKVAALFGMEAAVFCPSGTMTNTLALLVNTQLMDEVIVDKLSHIYNYENHGYAVHARLAVKLIEGDRGIIRTEQLESVINPDHDWLPNTRLVCIENTCNKGGGSFYTIEQMKNISAFCRKNNLRLHLDGARIFNGLHASGNKVSELHGLFDTISVCFSKGLGAPVGSVLIGNKEDIKRARKFRKAQGGGMRQAGILAAACIYALDHQVERLKDDHHRAKQIGETLKSCSFVKNVMEVLSNIVIFDLKEENSADRFLQKLQAQNILAVPFCPSTIRMVTHLDFTDEMLEKTMVALKNLK